MRSLIRPTLFLVARLGLFLAVVVWVLSPWWAFSTSGLLARTGSCETGWMVVVNPDVDVRWHFSVIPAERVYYRNMLFDPAADGSLVGRDGLRFSFLQLRSYPGQSGGAFSIAHWLIVTIFTLFNGVLMWVYRKRGEEAATDE